MPLLRRLLASALVVAAASALCVCAALASAGPLAAKSRHPTLSIAHRALPPVKALAPGDRAQRKLDLHYRGSGRFAVVVLRIKGPGHSLLGSSGLRLKIERCSRAWAKSGRAYGCHGRRWVVLKRVSITGRQPFALQRLTARAGRTDHLRLTLSLPPLAGNALQRQRSLIVYAFTGVAG
jgi:hypothetical protein